MVDQVQKMIEQVTSMQFKDLPALVDQIKNEVGVDQAQQFNADATAALAGLTQNLQGSKGQLETALGVVTGQAPAVPGADMAPAEMPAPDMGVEELPAVEPEEDEEVSDLEVSLGRGKR
jgi:ribosomal protein L7/L12